MEVTLNNLYLKFKTEDYNFLRALREEFSDYAPGYQFSGKFASGVWDGKISMFKYMSLPYGLLPDFLRFSRRDFPEINLNLSDDVKSLFSQEDIDNIEWDFLSKTPAPHQKLCVEAAIKMKRGIVLSCTGSGKCSYDIEIEIEIDDELYKNKFSEYENFDTFTK